MKSVLERTDDFVANLKAYKNLIDGAVSEFVGDIVSETGEQYGEVPSETVAVLMDYLARGGKRVRGALTMVAYEMLGGKDRKLILKAAVAIEVIQAYILMMDDIQDRSEVRRGGPTGHVMFDQLHAKKHLGGDREHFGRAMAMCSFQYGAHLGLKIISELPADPSLLVRAQNYLHECLIITNFGQSLDIYNEASSSSSVGDVDNVLIWKTAYYTFVNSLALGAILAGAEDSDLQLIKDYSLPVGRAFQIADDIIGVFGDESDSGKSSLDDIKEGKRTILTVEALSRAAESDAYFLRKCLGDQNLSMSDFKKCQEIISSCGALEYARSQAEMAAAEAKEALLSVKERWSTPAVEFLSSLADYVINRKA